MKIDPTLDKVATVFIGCGILGLLYKIVTNKIPFRTVDKIITTYNTGKMWRGFF